MTKLLTIPFLKGFTLTILLAVSGLGISQSSTVNSYVTGITAPLLRVSIQNGNILANKTPFLIKPNEDGYYLKSTKSISLEYGLQTFGGIEWHQTCQFPNMGIGIQYTRVMNRDDLGHPFALYGFYNGVYFRRKNFQLTNRLATGLASGFEIYDPNDPLSSDVISTRLNAFAELGVGFSLRLNDHFFVEPGFRFSHYSNGNIKEPQRGLNIAAYSISLNTVLGNAHVEPIKLPLGKYQHKQEVVAFLALAPRQIDFKVKNGAARHETYGMNYLIANFHTGYNYQLTRRFKLGTGADFFFDGTNGQQEIVEGEYPSKKNIAFRDKLGIAIVVNGETEIDKLSIVTTLGYIVFGKRYETSTPSFEQRLGFKYHFYKDFFAGANVRAYNFKAAKSIEFNIGVRKFLR